MSAPSAKARAEKKVKRQKQFIAVGSVVLLAIVGFEMTKVLSHGESATPAQSATTAASTSVVAGSTPSSPSASRAWNLPDTDRVVVQRNSDQLLSFGLFGSKDPFVQQLVTTPAAPSSPTPTPSPAPTTTTTTTTANPPTQPGIGLTPAPTTTASSPPAATPGTTTPTETAPTGPGSTTPSSPTAPPAPPTSVLIATNGVCESLSEKSTFPNGEDIFRVVSIARDGKSVEIGVVGGSYDSGQPTATLKLGGKLTLVNTADGTRYVIELKSKCAVIVQPTSRPTTTTTTTTVPIPAAPPATTTPTTTATTPIVPDSLDTTPPTN